MSTPKFEISKDEFDSLGPLPASNEPDGSVLSSVDKAISIGASRQEILDLSLKTIQRELAETKSMDNPIDRMKEKAAYIEKFLEYRRGVDMQEKGFITDFTRRWEELQIDLLDKIHKALYGEKSVVITGRLTPAQISMAMRANKKAREQSAPKEIVVEALEEDDNE